MAIDRKDARNSRLQLRGKNGFRYADGAWTAGPSRGARSISYSSAKKPGLNHLEPVPGFSAASYTKNGILLAPVADLVRMKLTSFRLKDKVHIIDLDSVGLITPEIEQGLPEALRDRLEQVRKEERQSTGAE